MMSVYGERLGYAIYGQLVTTDDGRLICGECGRSWKHLATHLVGAHGMTAAAYREKYGLSAGRSLVSAEVSGKLADVWTRHEAEHRARLDHSRDTVKAHAASGAKPGVAWRPETRAVRQATGRASRSRDLAPDEAASLGDGIDLQVWADAARSLIAESGVTLAALARASDISSATAAQRLRRYPQKSG